MNIESTYKKPQFVKFSVTISIDNEIELELLQDIAKDLYKKADYFSLKEAFAKRLATSLGLENRHLK